MENQVLLEPGHTSIDTLCLQLGDRLPSHDDTAEKLQRKLYTVANYSQAGLLDKEA